MNLRFSAIVALSVAVASIVQPAFAGLVINTGLSTDPSSADSSSSDSSSTDHSSTDPSSTDHSSTDHSSTVAKTDLSGDAVTTNTAGIIEFRPHRASTVVRQSKYVATNSNDNPRPMPMFSRSESYDGSSYNGRETTVDRNAALGIVHMTTSGMTLDQSRVIEFDRDMVSTAALSSLVSGWANSVPLDMALAQVVPADWSIRSKGTDLKRVVSWRGNRPWIDVLSELARQGKFNANVVWDRKAVVVFPMWSVDGTDLHPIPQSRQHFYIKSAVAPSITQSAPRPVQPQSVNIWKIDPHLTLRGNIEAWTKRAGWNSVVWEAADYPMVAPAEFRGEFTSPNGPLAKLIEAYSESDQPLEVTLSTMDKVVHVTNKNYEPATIVPMTPSRIVPRVFDTGHASTQEKEQDR